MSKALRRLAGSLIVAGALSFIGMRLQSWQFWFILCAVMLGNLVEYGA